MLQTLKTLTLGAFALTLVSACGGGEETTDPAPEAAAVTETLANGMTVSAQIEARQEAYKTIGKNFKAVSDQLKAGSPDIAAIQAAAAELPAAAAGMADWFPEGTGPESGVETDALALIWAEQADFGSKVNDSQAALSALNVAAQSGDIAAISAAFQTAGGTCKACHDKFRLDD